MRGTIMMAVSPFAGLALLAWLDHGMPLPRRAILDRVSLSAFAILLSLGSVLVLINGAVGATGNQVVTGAVFVGATALVAASPRLLHLNLLDAIFAAFLAVVCFSTWINGMPPARDAVLFSLALAAYPAGRLLPRSLDLATVVSITGAIVAVGSVATVATLVQTWGVGRGRPEVLGFAHGATVFASSLCFLVLLLVSAPLDSRHTWRTCAAIFLPAAIFAACQVRFAFAALFGALALSFVKAPASQRHYVMAVIATLLLAITVGMGSNSRLMFLYMDTMTKDLPDPKHERSACLDGGTFNNSIAIRKALIRDAVAAIPSAGLVGTGLSSFRSCVPDAAPHNSILQATVEFGWLGGLTLYLLIATALYTLWRSSDPASRFALLSLSFVGAMCMAHGNLTQDTLLFLFLGYAGSCVKWREQVCTPQAKRFP